MTNLAFWSTSEVSMGNPSVTESSNCHALKKKRKNLNGENDDPLLRQVESDMTEDEVKKFEEDWINLWNPDITK